jgi:predicted ATPase
MNIREVYVDGFDNIVDTRITLSNLTALLAVNNYGKSNLLSAVKAGLALPGLGKMSQRRFIRSMEHVSLTRHTNERSEFLPKLFNFEVVFETILNGRNVTVRYGYTVKWMRYVDTEYLRVSDNGSGGKLYINREQGKTKYLSSDTGRCDRSLLTDSNTLAITTLSYLEDKYTFHELPRLICGIAFPLFDTLDTAAIFSGEGGFYQESTSLLGIARSNIRKALYLLKETKLPTFELIENTFITLFPQYTRIIVDKISRDEDVDDGALDDDDFFFTLLDEEYSVLFLDKYLVRPVSAEKLSNGTRRVLNMLICAAIAHVESNPIFGIEEIETSIHPAKIGDFLDVLTQLAPECKFIVTSHSPSVAQYLKSDTIYVGQPRDDGNARFRRLPKESSMRLTKEARQFGITIGEMIFNQLSSGSMAEKYLSDLLEG